MRRLIVFSVIAILFAWSGFPDDLFGAVLMFAFFAALFGAVRFVGALVLGQAHTWAAWRDRITQVITLEAGFFFFCAIQSYLETWRIGGAHVLLTTLEVLPALIFVLLSWRVARVSFKKEEKPIPLFHPNPLCQCGAEMNASRHITTKYMCPACGNTSTPR
jgi:hypothetical protein